MCLCRKHFLFRTEMFEASHIIWQRRRWPLTMANSRIPFSGATKSSFYWQLHTNTKSSILASAPRYAKCIGCFLKRPSVDKQYNVTATCFAHQWVGTYLLFVSQSNIRPQLRAELKTMCPSAYKSFISTLANNHILQEATEWQQYPTKSWLYWVFSTLNAALCSTNICFCFNSLAL